MTSTNNFQKLNRTYDITFKLDSGANDHMANEKTYFTTKNKLTTPAEINVAKDCESITASHIGEIQAVSNKCVEIFMKDVLYAPDLRDNLLSVRKIIESGLAVSFQKNMAVIVKGKEGVATASLQGSL